MALSAVTQRRIELYVAAHSRARASLVQQLLVLLARFWRALEDKNDPAQVAQYTDRVAAAVASARRAQGNLTDSYLTRVLTEMDVEPGRPGVVIDDLPRGIPLAEEYVRPVKEYRRLTLIGFDEFEANERALARARLIGETDVTMAMRDASHQRLALADRVTGWRRVIHPELSAGGTCGLCVAASDRVYRKIEKIAVHDRCHCEVLPIVAGKADPGRTLNRADLQKLYDAAGGSTAAGDLARTRWVVHEHGELGPVLRAAGDHFRDAEEVAEDTADETSAA